MALAASGTAGFPTWVYAAVGGGLLVVAFIGIALLRSRGGKPVALRLHPQFEPGANLDRIVARLLKGISQWVNGQAYYAYWLNAEGSALQLRASIAETGNPDVVPDYSGLIIASAPVVPLSVAVEKLDQPPRVSGTRNEPWLEFAVGRHLLVRILLQRREKVPANLLAGLRQAGSDYAPLVQAVYEWFKAREDLDRVRGLVDTSRFVLDTTLRPDRAIGLLQRVGGQMLEAQLQCGIVAGHADPLLVADTDEGRIMARRILQGESPNLLALPPAPDVVGGSHLGSLGDRYNACVRVPVLLGGDVLGCFFYFLETAASLNSYQSTVLTMLADRAAHLVQSHRQMESASAGYVDTLRALVDAMDGLSPHSVGHSDRLARYARMTAEELRLPADQVDAIVMAAYFHDVGMVAIDPRVVLKPGRLTAMEYEQVKTHAELGGQLVGPLEASLPLAPMVTAHHERWDGRGYPNGLSGEAIPLGARIISAVDLFDAKTTGRSYRAPQPFPQALAALQTVSGSHLDPKVTAALLAAWERQRRSAGENRPIGRCWEMKQLQPHVCAGCQNRVNQLVRCWEQPHLCTRHGDECETCFVYTEAISRGLVRVPEVTGR